MLPLRENDIRALHVALEHEYRSFAIHARILSTFGPAPSLERIRDVEAGHIHVLECLLRRYDVPLPRNRGHLHMPRFADVSHACAAAIEAEREHLVLYRHLIESAREADVLAELRNLERASRDGHLPALHAWARQLGHHGHARAGANHALAADIRRARVAPASEHRRLPRR